jgi:hypothetical protein
MSPFSLSGPDGNRTQRTDLARVSRLLGTCQPIRREVRPGIEPGLRPYQGRVRPKHLQTDLQQVIADGIEPSLSWMSTRRLSRWTTRSSDQGGSRTHKHEALDLAAFPVCVPSHGGFGGRTRQARLMRPH